MFAASPANQPVPGTSEVAGRPGKPFSRASDAAATYRPVLLRQVSKSALALSVVGG